MMDLVFDTKDKAYDPSKVVEFYLLPIKKNLFLFKLRIKLIKAFCIFIAYYDLYSQIY